MKRSIKRVVLLFVLIFSSVIFSKQTSAQRSGVSFQVFYDELSPYGEWVNHRNYGYVWIPYADSDFAPYSTNGYWITTDYGWTWVSGYEWGWAPFHYGRWDYNNYYGWFWVPGNEWGPSWVNWRRADGYYGWSPMEPGISLNSGFGRAYDGNNDHWMFVRDRDFDRHDINRYFVSRADQGRIVRNSTVINTTYTDNSRHVTYVTGPATTEVQRVTGRSINPVTIRENSRPGQKISNGQLQIYRPQINRSNKGDRESAPARITNLRDVKRPSERSGSIQQRTATPTGNNMGRQQQQNSARPQYNIQPGQQRTATPTGNNMGRQQQQQNSARPQYNIQPGQQRTATPTGNNMGRQQHQNTERQQNNNGQPSQQKSAPVNTNERQQQQVEQQAQQQQQVQQQRQQQQAQQQQQVQQQRQQQQAEQQQQVQQQRQQQQAEQQQRQPNAVSPEQPRESRSEQIKKRND